jgi:hypothetical protein
MKNRILLLLLAANALAVSGAEPAAPKWKNGLSTDPHFFPIAVWLQSPRNAERYKAAGINTYVGLWDGPTEEQLAALKKAGMRVFCEQNSVALKHLDDPMIAGWMHGDEPDNAQANPGGKGYGPPITPEKIQSEYVRIQTADPTRPVMLNLGQGVAYDQYIGRGVRRGHLEDYPEYIKGGDIVSFDIYPAVHETPEIAGQLWYVAKGVERLVDWCRGERIVWNCLECTHIGNPNRKATPQEVRAEAWMSIIHGSRGIIWFVHQFRPKFREAALLDDAPMLEAVTAINREITELAPVINDPAVRRGVMVKSEDAQAPVAMMSKQHEGRTYLFTVGMRGHETRATFTVPGLADGAKVEVIGENRTLESKGGSFADAFPAWGVHLYRMSEGSAK